jgi:hypothetical protein
MHFATVGQDQMAGNAATGKTHRRVMQGWPCHLHPQCAQATNHKLPTRRHLLVLCFVCMACKFCLTFSQQQLARVCSKLKTTQTALIKTSFLVFSRICAALKADRSFSCALCAWLANFV